MENGTVVGIGKLAQMNEGRRRLGRMAMNHARCAMKAMSDGGMDMAKNHVRKMAFCASKAFADMTDEESARYAPPPAATEDVSEVYRQFGNEPPKSVGTAVEPTDDEIAAEEAKLAEKERDIISPVVDDMVKQLKDVVDSGELDDKKKKEIEGLLERIQTEAPSLRAAVEQARTMLDEIKPAVAVEETAEGK